jgi:endonuclease YncB( thermonuclease family)
VSRIIDGDTIEVNPLDLGDRVYRVRRIRLLGFNAPELFSGDNREAGKAARDALAAILPIGSSVYLHTQLDRESFDRLLAWAFVDDTAGNLHGVHDLMASGGYTV